MSFGQKNTWPRPAAPSGQLNPAMFSNIAGQQFGMLNVPNMQHVNALVNQAAFGNIIAQQQQRPPLLQQIPTQQQPQRNQSPQNKKRSFVGSISKFLDTYGFIDDEVFFQASVVTGGQPTIGARCMVEAVYNSSMPFHWNATSVQMIPDNNPPAMHNNMGGRSRMQGGNRWDPSPSNGPDSRSRGPDDRYNNHRGGDRDIHPVGRTRSPPPRREPRPVIRRSPPRRLSPGKSPIRRPEKRERTPRVISPRRDTSVRASSREPPRRRARITPRYACRAVRPVVNKHVTCADLRTRYKSLYVPSDFVSAEMSWLDSFPLDAPSQIGVNAVNFHVCHKDVDFESPDYTPEQLTPPTDEDHRFTVRILLLTNPGIVEFRKKVFSLLPDGSIDEANENVSFNKAVHFLTGIRGRNEVMAIGGAWSPTVDGGDPTSLGTQIKVAVRSTLQLTGLDLSNVSTWYKMAHLEYYRAERDRVDNVVLLLPDTSSLASLMPSPEVYAATVAKLKEQLAAKIGEIDAQEFVSTVDKRRKEAATTPKPSATTTAPATTATDPSTATTTAPSTTTATTTESVPVEGAPAAAAGAVAADVATNEGADDETKMETDGGPEKIHWSTTISALRVADLREQLTLRGLDTKGVKNVLIQRLQKALDEEKAAEGGEEVKQEAAEAKPEEAAAPPAAAVEEVKTEEPTEPKVKEDEPMETDAAGDTEITLDQLEEKQDEDDYTAEELEEIRREREKFDVINTERKAALTRHYVFPEQPALLIFPSKTAKNGRFECKVSSLSSLLEYRVEDNKEASFEVFVFAEAAREMFDRSAAFTVYKTLQSSNDLEVELAKRKEALTAAYSTPAPEATSTEPTTEESTPAEAKPSETATTEAASTPVKDETATPAEEKKPEIDERELLAHFKQLVGNFDAFSAFAYYDYNVAGYITVPDLEDVLLTIGLRLSRGDILRLCKRLSSRDRLSYRIFTDRWVNKDLEVKYAATPKEDAPAFEKLVEVHPRSALDEGSAATNGDAQASEIIVYKGAAFNVKQVMEEHEETKNECTKLHTLVQEQEHVLKNYKEQVDGLEKRKKRLESDVSYYRKKAHDADKLLKTNEDELVILKTALVDSRRLSDRISAIVDRTLIKKEKTKEPEATDASKKPEGEQEKKESDEATKEEPTNENGNAEGDASTDAADKKDEPAVESATAAEAVSSTETAGAVSSA